MTRNRAPRLLAHQAGFTLIELVIVMAVIGLILGGIFAAWGAVNSQNKMRRAQDQITIIVNQVRSAYGNRNEMESVSGASFTGALINAGLLPDSWVTAQTPSLIVGNPYGGGIVVTPVAAIAGGTSKNAFSIALSGVDKASCYKLVSNMLGTGRSQGLYKIDSKTVDGTTTFASIKDDNLCKTTDVSFFFTLKSGT